MPILYFHPRLALIALFALGATLAQAATTPSGPKDDFMPYVELTPFVVNGKQFAISIHARSTRDRHYAEDFAEEVVKVVAESVTEDTGKGLVIIGKKGEPHPIFVFRKFLALAKEGKLDRDVAARGPELYAMLNHWQGSVGDGKTLEVESDEGVDLEFEKIITALPLPLEGVGAKLYQLAWREGFDDKKVEAKLRALRPADLEGNTFARFDWVFYLPPRGAFEQAIDDIIAAALKEEKAGFMERMAVKGVMVAVKPSIRRAIEAIRRGLMFSAVVQARTKYDDTEVSALTAAYIDALMPEHKDTSLPEHARVVQAVQARIKSLGEKPATKEQPDAEPEPAAEKL
jgi:hypothetical protein